jgi:2-polyprenyl-6-methoxyphenol hydroxylase-like FAD-dependent oxidoreductase
MSQRVLISGASVAGPSLAFWLIRYGFDVTVVERAPGIRPGGYAVDFRGSGMKSLERMGLVEAVKQHETRTGSIVMVNEKDEVIARLPDGFTSGELEVLRGDLARILYDATRQDAAYIFADSIQSITDDGTQASVRFASGREDTFDAIIGADGLHSNVRALAFGDEAQFARNLGYQFAVFTVPDFMSLGNRGRYYAEVGRRVGCFGTPNNGMATASLHFATTRHDYDRRDVASQKSLLRETFSGMKWKTRQILDLMDAAPDFYFDSLSQVRMERWSKGRVVLMGDAASCATPMSGMGTSIAMVGAYVLAGEMKECGGDYAHAYNRYEATMRPFVVEAQKLADGVGWFVPDSRWKLWFSTKMWSWMPKSTLHKLMIEQPTQVANLVPLKNYD